MKLQNLVESAQQLTPNHFKDFQFTMDGVEAVMEFFEALKGYKFTEISVMEDEVSIEASNNLVNVWLNIVAEPNHVFSCTIQVSIVDSLLAWEGAASAIKTFGQGLRLKESEIESYLKGEFKDAAVEAANNFSEWYFDMSGEHGKLKVAIWRKGQSDEADVVAIGGMYNLKNMNGKVL